MNTKHSKHRTLRTASQCEPLPVADPGPEGEDTPRQDRDSGDRRRKQPDSEARRRA